MATYRIDRINKELLRMISTLLHSKIKKEDVRGAIVTEVDTLKDLSHAKVYYTLVDEKKRELVQEALDKVAGQVRAHLSKEMRLRTVPEIEFIFDDSEIKARSIDALLDRIAEADSGKAEE
jgi:ribosome-binding factor A